jgi:hypothetical protein
MMGTPMDKAEAFDLLFAFVADLAGKDAENGDVISALAIKREAENIMARIKGHEYDPGDGYDAEGEAPAE